MKTQTASLWLLLAALLPQPALGQIEVTKDFKFELGKPYTVIDAPTKSYFRTPDGVVAMKVDGDTYVVQKLSGETLTQVCMKETRDFPKGHALDKMVVFNERMLVFYSTWDKSSQTEELWVREVDLQSCGFSGPGRSILRVQGKLSGAMVNKGWYNISVVGKYSFVPSLDGERMLITYRKKPEEKDDSKNKDVIGMVVFNKEMAEEWRSELTMPYTEEKMDNLDTAVDSDGNGYILALVREKDPKDMKRGEEMPSHIELLRFGAGASEFDITPVDLGTMYVSDISLFEGKNDEMLCAGYYRKTRKATGAEGLFSFSVTKQGGIGHVNNIDIPLEVVNQYTSERTQRKNAAKEADGDVGVGIPNLDMDMVVVNEDGSMVLIGERYFSVYHSGTQNRIGYYSYHYEDLLVTSIAADGHLNWMKKLPKRQMTLVPPGGCSFSYFESPSSMYLLFMDHIENLHADPNKVPEVHVDGRGGFLTGYRVDPTDGSVTKTSILDTRDAKGMELFQVGINRVVAVSDTEFLMEAYKKQKEDILVRVFLDTGK